MSPEIEAARDGPAGPVCLNCGARLSGSFCSGCGQKARVHRTLGAFAHDALHSVLHFDGKLWRTLPLLAWHPGRLTRRYVLGERARFVSPLALFLFCVFLAYAVVGLAAPAVQLRGGKPAAGITEEALSEAMRDAREGAAGEDEPGARTAALVSERLIAQAALSKTAVAALDERIAQAGRDGAAMRALEDERAAERQLQQVLQRAAEQVDLENIGNAVRFQLGNESVTLKFGNAFKNPQLLIYRLQTNAYKFAWALIPISVPFVWLLLFWHREFKLFDHAVFVTYSLCFMLMLFTLIGAVTRVPVLNEVGSAAMGLVPPLHMYRQVRYAYGLTRWGAAWRTGLLLLFALVTLGLFGALISFSAWAPEAVA